MLRFALLLQRGDQVLKQACDKIKILWRNFWNNVFKRYVLLKMISLCCMAWELYIFISKQDCRKHSMLIVTNDFNTHACYHSGQPHTKAFLSHGGLNSIYEAMYHGVPVVGVPLFGDHYDTMTRVAAKGMGIMLHWKDMTEEDLYASLSTVINDPRLDWFRSSLLCVILTCTFLHNNLMHCFEMY